MESKFLPSLEKEPGTSFWAMTQGGARPGWLRGVREFL